MNKRKTIERLKRDFEIVGDGVAHMTTDGKKRLLRKCLARKGYKPSDTPSI